MKHVLLLISLLFFSHLSPAQNQGNRNSSIQFKLRNNRLLTVVMDGRHYQKFGKTLTLGNIPPGNHEVKVYRYYPNDDPRYAGYNARPKAVLLYRGKIRIYPVTMYFCTVDPEYRTMGIKESRLNNNYYEDNAQQIEDEPEFSERMEESRVVEQNIQPYKQETVEEQNTPQNSYTPTKTSKENNSKPLTQLNNISISEMSALANTVKNKKTDTEKLNYLKDNLQHKRINISQLNTMLDWFTFEGSKLDWVQWAYPHLNDPNSVNEVLPKFNFTSSKTRIKSLGTK